MLTRFSSLLCLLFLALVQTTQGCTIPVFRYALDRWEADPFHLLLPDSSTQDPVLTDLLRPLRANGKANLNIETSKDPALKVPELRFSTRNQAPLWSGAVDGVALGALLDSPMRKKLEERILAGDSVVWVIAERGLPEDAAHVERIEKRIKFLEQVASLPIQDPNDPDSQLGPGPPLKLAFTILRVNSSDPAEAVFLKMMAGPTSDIDPEKTSFTAAVFGRGRVLGAWALDRLDDTSLEDACMFLVGRCSCRLKNENPGWDILMNVDWVKALEGVGTAQPESAKVPAPLLQPESVTTASTPPPPVAVAVVSTVRAPWVAVSLALVMGVVAVVMLRRGAARK